MESVRALLGYSQYEVRYGGQEEGVPCLFVYSFIFHTSYPLRVNGEAGAKLSPRRGTPWIGAYMLYLFIQAMNFKCCSWLHYMPDFFF